MGEACAISLVSSFERGGLREVSSEEAKLAWGEELTLLHRPESQCGNFEDLLSRKKTFLVRAPQKTDQQLSFAILLHVLRPFPS